jgi:hypothetical protein
MDGPTTSDDPNNNNNRTQEEGDRAAAVWDAAEFGGGYALNVPRHHSIHRPRETTNGVMYCIQVSIQQFYSKPESHPDLDHSMRYYPLIGRHKSKDFIDLDLPDGTWMWRTNCPTLTGWNEIKCAPETENQIGYVSVIAVDAISCVPVTYGCVCSNEN